jgi:hypothetical protein
LIISENADARIFCQAFRLVHGIYLLFILYPIKQRPAYANSRNLLNLNIYYDYLPTNSFSMPERRTVRHNVSLVLECENISMTETSPIPERSGSGLGFRNADAGGIGLDAEAQPYCSAIKAAIPRVIPLASVKATIPGLAGFSKSYHTWTRLLSRWCS